MNGIEQLSIELKDAQSRILELEKRSLDNLIFLDTFNSSPVPFCLNDENGQILNVNAVFSKVFGYEKEEISSLSEWWPRAYPDPKYREWVKQTWYKKLEVAQQSKADFEPLEVKIRCKNGTYRDILVSAAQLTHSFVGIHLIILYDITEIKQAQRKIGDLSDSLTSMSHSLEQQYSELTAEKEKSALNEERLRLAMQGSNDGLWDWDVVANKIYFAPRWKSMLGYAEHEIEDQFTSWKNLLHPDDVDVSLANIQTFLDKKSDKYQAEFRMLHKSGQYLNILSRAFAIESEEGKITRMVGTHVDITARKKAEEQLNYQSSHDSSTDLVNRREFERRLESFLVSSKKNGHVHALCYMDLDQFKIVNDTCGHAAGDEMLRQLGALLQKAVRRSDTVARLGGDEFGLLMWQCSLEEAQRITSGIQSTIQDYQFVWQGRSFRVGVSIGLVQITNKTPNLSELLRVADVACYMAKDAGRNRIHVYYDDDEELAKRQGEMQWVTRIQHALDEDRFCLYAQAIESLDHYSGMHHELLLRMIDEDGEIIPPGAFLPAAERYNIIGQLDRWVVQKTVELLNKYPKFLASTHFISINLSGQSLTNETFLDFVIRQLQTLNGNSAKVCFEITETAAISNLVVAGRFISELRQLGCRFALDDFGSGLSSFGYLKNLQVDYLKIDGAFVKDIVADPIDRAMVKAINEIGHVMGMKTIAEFVENDDIKALLAELGVNFAQGYGIHRPSPFIELLNTSDSINSQEAS